MSRRSCRKGRDTTEKEGDQPVCILATVAVAMNSLRRLET